MPKKSSHVKGRFKPSSRTSNKIASILWKKLWAGSKWRKLATSIIVLFILWFGAMFAVGQWYIHKHKNQPLVLGTTFISDYASSFGLDPHQALDGILGDLGMKQLRLVGYWSTIEKTSGTYDFSDLDWQFAMANHYGAKVSLAIGLRQPRWPECHVPDWAANEPKSVWQPQLNKFITAVVDRYKANPALGDYELENEFFLSVFGECKDFDRQRLVSEFKMVKQTDPNHHVIVSRSDNWVGIPIGQPTPDEFAISVYKRVWDATFTHRYFEYPLPSWFYASLAGYEEMLSGKDMIIHELQAEPWTPNGLLITQISVPEQYKSMSPQRMKTRIAYGEATGMRTIDLWGAEWWYWLKVTKGDPSVWNVVKQAVTEANVQNQKLVQK